MPSGSSSRSRRNRGAAAEADGKEEQHAVTKQIDAIGEQQLEADAIGEQQLCTESFPVPDYSHRQMRGK